MTAWSKLLAPGDLFVDVGANAGLYTIWALDLGATVIAIEPSPIMMSQLKKNVELNSSEIEARECGVSDAPGRAYLDGPDYLRNHLCSPGDDTVDTSSATMVAVETLDSILSGRHVRGLKVDVEGFERKVLQGATQSLSNQAIDILQLEWNSTSLDTLQEDRVPLKRLLEGFGYILCRPNMQGALEPCVDAHFGPDMFAISRRVSQVLSSDS